MLKAICLLSLAITSLYAKVELGVDRLFSEREYRQLLHGKQIGLVTNHTGQNSKRESTLDLFERHAGAYQLKAVFAPEHGLTGSVRAEHKVKEGALKSGVPVYSLFGATRRPTKSMLEGIDLLVYDIQDIGARTYTYASTLFYVMEEAAKYGIPVLVLDRPNPINGSTVDGPIVEEEKRSFAGYLEIPLCHGMTLGELARYFNVEYQVGCTLGVIRMKGWKRKMSLADCGLPWVPPSPQIPDQETPVYFLSTGLLGEALSNVSIGVGYTLPFKVVGAPWIEGKSFAAALNKQKFPGVWFEPFDFAPFFGRFKGETCHGIRLVVTDPLIYKPVSTDFLIIGMLKSVYPKKFDEGIRRNPLGKKMLGQMAGTDAIYQILTERTYIAWELIGLHEEERELFKQKRKPYLLYK